LLQPQSESRMRTSNSNLWHISMHAFARAISWLTGSKSQTRVYKSLDKVWNCDAVHGEISDDFSQVVHNIPDHNHHAEIGHEQRRRTDEGENRARSNKQTCSDSTTESPGDLLASRWNRQGSFGRTRIECVYSSIHDVLRRLFQQPLQSSHVHARRAPRRLLRRPRIHTAQSGPSQGPAVRHDMVVWHVGGW
jgi:hypothetical protein